MENILSDIYTSNDEIKIYDSRSSPGSVFVEKPLRMSTGGSKDLETCRLLEKEDEIGRGWLWPALVGFKMGVVHICWSCGQSLGQIAQFLHFSYFERLQPYLYDKFLDVEAAVHVCFFTICAFAVSQVKWLACLFIFLCVLSSTVAIILTSMPFATESYRQWRFGWIRVFLVQAAVAMVTVPSAGLLYKTEGHHHRRFLDFATDYIDYEVNKHGSKFSKIVTAWALSFLGGFVGGIFLSIFLLVMSGSAILIYLLLDGFSIYLIDIVTWIRELCSHFIFHKSDVVVFSPGPASMSL
ncbi:hypothetical protein R1flu_028544 [Riccia fluitans]|uniref:Uncharacterized protein n=1 Tax=Riccia fluitans TaxID=41844 RepID=A0ABD1XPZ1_9MARC